MEIKKNITALALFVLAGASLPFAAMAATPCPDYTNKIVKTDGAYWFIQDGQRWQLVDADVVSTWDKAVVAGRKDCVETLPNNGGQLSFRAGTRLLKQAGSNTIYAAGMRGFIHLIDSPEVAAQWYGPRWGSLVRTVSPEVFAKFHVGEQVGLDRPNNGAIVRQSGQSAWYQVREGQLVRITGAIRPAIYNNTRVLSAELFKKIPLSANTITSAEVLATIAAR